MATQQEVGYFALTVDSKGFRCGCITLRITGFVDCVNRPVLYLVIKYSVLETRPISVIR
jgi:hypothetical protein